MTDVLGTTIENSGDTLSPGASVAGYEIVRVLGRGGMAIVYEARHRQLNKRVAIKMMQPAFAYSEQAKERFLREAQTAASIHHPNVVDVSDVGVADGFPFMVMDLLKGEDLGTRIEREALSEREATDITLPVIAALAIAHDSGVIHRDLKPDNIFLDRVQGRWVPKVLDFGISKVRETGDQPGLTNTDALLGTPYYMSPEQAQGGKRVDHRSDQFSLAVTIYECITGQRPFAGASLYEILGQIINHLPPPCSERVSGVSPEFAEVIARAMSKQPDDRFPSIRELGLALLPFASDSVAAHYEPELMAPPASHADFSAGATLPIGYQTGDRSAGDTGARRASPSGSAPRRAPTPGRLTPGPVGTGAPVASGTDGDATVWPDGVPRRAQIGRPVVLGLAATVVLLGSALAYVLLVPSRPPGPEPSAHSAAMDSTASAAPPAQPAPSAVPAPPAPALPKLRKIETLPSAASVEMDGQEVSTSLGTFEMPASGKHVVRVSAPGYATETFETPEDVIPNRIELRRVPHATKTPSSPSTKKPPAQPAKGPSSHGHSVGTDGVPIIE